jgi:non-ribosomal peptide synthase protein (TIGR01720 family)
MDVSMLEQALQAVIAHHEALRLRFQHTQEGWRQSCAPTEEATVFSWFDLQWLPAEERETLMRNAVDGLHTGLDLSQGPLCRVAYFRRGHGQPDRLVWVIHHLAVDAVSWGILLEDLETAYHCLEQGTEVQLPSCPTAFSTWATQLDNVAREGGISSQQNSWQNYLTHESFSLPVDYQSSINREADVDRIAVSLPEAFTQMLLRQIPRAWQVEVHDLLLATLGLTLARWRGDTHIQFDCERHGRDDGLTGLDITRTVGWFTVIHPVRLVFSSIGDDVTVVRTALRQLSDISDDWLVSSLLRYPPKGEVSLVTAPPAAALFNYLGQVDVGLAGARDFTLVNEPNVQVRSPLGERSHLLEIDAEVSGAQLRMEWKYSQAIHDRRTIELQALRYRQILESVCHSALEKQNDDAKHLS